MADYNFGPSFVRPEIYTCQEQWLALNEKLWFFWKEYVEDNMITIENPVNSGKQLVIQFYRFRNIDTSNITLTIIQNSTPGTRTEVPAYNKVHGSDATRSFKIYESIDETGGDYQIPIKLIGSNFVRGGESSTGNILIKPGNTVTYAFSSVSTNEDYSVLIVLAELP